MRLVFIYGPPAVGKLTTASALAKLTGLKLFHNHLTSDLARSLFPFGSRPFAQLCIKLRLDTFQFAAQAGIKGMIFTFCYSQPQDDQFVADTIKVVEQAGGEVNFVRLYCRPELLASRVVSPERERFTKINNVTLLDQVMLEWNLWQPVPQRKSLEIDNSELEAITVATRICQHYTILPSEDQPIL